MTATTPPRKPRARVARTAKIVLESIKDPDGWGLLQGQLNLSDAKIERFFEYGEYADLELVIDSNMRIVGGRVLPRRRS